MSGSDRGTVTPMAETIQPSLEAQTEEEGDPAPDLIPMTIAGITGIIIMTVMDNTGVEMIGTIGLVLGQGSAATKRSCAANRKSKKLDWPSATTQLPMIWQCTTCSPNCPSPSRKS